MGCIADIIGDCTGDDVDVELAIAEAPNAGGSTDDVSSANIGVVMSESTKIGKPAKIFYDAAKS